MFVILYLSRVCKLRRNRIFIKKQSKRINLLPQHLFSVFVQIKIKQKIKRKEKIKKFRSKLKIFRAHLKGVKRAKQRMIKMIDKCSYNYKNIDNFSENRNKIKINIK